MDKVQQIVNNLFVTETVVRDEMHPSRTVNTIYVVDGRGPEVREHFVSQTGFNYGPTLDFSKAYAIAKKFI